VKKVIFIFIGCLILIFSGFVKCMDAKERVIRAQPTQVIKPVKKNDITINEEDKACAVDTDCGVVSVRCGDCGLDVANKSYIKYYESELEQICGDYKLACDLDYRATHEIKCVDLKCGLARKETHATVNERPESDQRIIEKKKAGFGEKLYSCQTDLDCTWVETGCCPARGLAISKAFQDDWNSMRSEICQDKYVCVAVVMRDARDIPKCVQSQCLLENVRFSNKSLNVCSLILREDEKDWCYFDAAIRELDPHGCKKISNEYQRDECFWELRQKSSPTMELCELMDARPQKDDCWMALAKTKGDVRYCKEIQENQKNSNCYHETMPHTENFEICAEFDSYHLQAPYYRYGSCVASVAKNKRVPQLCDFIPEENKFYSYWFNCVLEIAESTKNINFCDQISARRPPKNYSSAFSAEGCKRKVKTGSFKNNR